MQRILTINIVTQGLKSIFFELKNIELCNALPDELDHCGINTYQISIMKNNRSDTKENLKRRGTILILI